jgi:hypothetical protein
MEEKENALIMMAANSEVLLLPERATSLVSRAEVVNLIVVEYTEKIEQQVADMRRELDTVHATCSEAWKAAYTAWTQEIRDRALLRLTPWHNAVRDALDGAALSDLASAALPNPTECKYSSFGVHASKPHNSHQEREIGLVDVVRAWLDRRGREKPDFGGSLVLSSFGGGSEIVHLARFPMIWMFATEARRDRGDWHYLRIHVDARPSAEVVLLLEAAINACNAHLSLAQKISNLQGEVADENIRNLERRALAKLTLQALGESVPRPALG